jgi:hypothetical protein
METGRSALWDWQACEQFIDQQPDGPVCREIRGRHLRAVAAVPGRPNPCNSWCGRATARLSPPNAERAMPDTSVRTQMILDLTNLIAALDRRLPQLSRHEEPEIARQSEELRARAVALLELLEAAQRPSRPIRSTPCRKKFGTTSTTWTHGLSPRAISASWYGRRTPFERRRRASQNLRRGSLRVATGCRRALISLDRCPAMV